jgi:hypothetical protein
MGHPQLFEPWMPGARGDNKNERLHPRQYRAEWGSGAEAPSFWGLGFHGLKAVASTVFALAREALRAAGAEALFFLRRGIPRPEGRGFYRIRADARSAARHRG